MNDVAPEHVLLAYQEHGDGPMHGPMHDYSAPHVGQLLRKPGSRLMLCYDLSSLERWMDGKMAIPAEIPLEQETYTTPEVAELEHIISSFVSSYCSVRYRYGQGLREK
ncbi:hypothetical protein N7501_010081 [Penicillium viridicatum]|nr:hypothetical protein N7501_010081 [Penicillium viridicatum]